MFRNYHVVTSHDRLASSLRPIERVWRAARPFAAILVWFLVLTPAFGQEFEYTLGTGDQLRITVFGHDDLSGDFEVGTGGFIAFPLIGEVAAVGATPQELEASIIQKLKPNYLKNPQVSVEVANYRPFYIIGEVKNPGSYAYVGGMRVVNAVAMAGGFTYRAKEKKLLITRAKGGGNQESATQDTLVYPGDVIEVPERFF
jgi:polysaccharide export outer membrane protein